MTLRDLTRRQLYNLRRRSRKEWKQVNKKSGKPAITEDDWNTAYSKGLKAGLDVPRP